VLEGISFGQWRQGNHNCRETIVSSGDLDLLAKSWNAQAINKGATSKYVESVLVDPQSGEISIIFKSAMVGVAPTENLLIISPFVRVNGNVIKPLKNALAAGESGVVDCFKNSADRNFKWYDRCNFGYNAT